MEQAIAVLSDLKNVSELLEGASIEQARLVPSIGRLQLELEVTRACPELKTTVRRGLMRKTTIPWVKSRLTVGQITGVSIQRAAEAPAGQTPVLACEAVPGGYTLTVTSPDGLQLTLALDQLQGQFADLGRPIGSP